MNARSGNTKFLENLAYHSAHWAGSPWAYLPPPPPPPPRPTAGPLVQFSEGWQLIMKTASGTVTFIMVFLIQRSQDKNSTAMQIKLNEIIAALHGANNRMISIENLSEGEINALQKDYQNLATQIHKDNETSVHAVSLEEAIAHEEALADL